MLGNNRNTKRIKKVTRKMKSSMMMRNMMMMKMMERKRSRSCGTSGWAGT